MPVQRRLQEVAGIASLTNHLTQKQQEKRMFELIAVVVVIAVSIAIYKSGKQEGSRKGFHAGRSSQGWKGKVR